MTKDSAPTSNVATDVMVWLRNVGPLIRAEFVDLFNRLGPPPQEQAPRDALPVPEDPGSRAVAKAMIRFYQTWLHEHPAQRCSNEPPTAGIPSPSVD